MQLRPRCPGVPAGPWVPVQPTLLQDTESRVESPASQLCSPSRQEALSPKGSSVTLGKSWEAVGIFSLRSRERRHGGLETAVRVCPRA